jgi:uncharacterized protein with gpF-like domain
MRFERKYRILFRKALIEQGKMVLREIDRGVTDAGYLSAFISEEPIATIYKNLYTEVVPYFAQREYKRLLNQKFTQISLWELTAMQWVQGVGGTRIRNIAATSRTFVVASVQSAVQESIAQGMGAFEATQYIRKTFYDDWVTQSFYRAERIARTEVMSAYSYGNNEGARATGLTNLRKVWVTSLDGRERPSHAAANRQQVAFDEPFTVGGVAMMYPHDPNGGAANVIQCRCTQLNITPLNEQYGKN